MTRIRMLAVACLFLSLCSPWVAGDDKAKPDDKNSGAKMRGTLPQNWGKLGLSEEQKQKIYKVQNDYGTKIDALQKQIADMRATERKDMERVLTAAQRDRLREILAGKVPGETKK